jgi:hypothetical protein
MAVDIACATGMEARRAETCSDEQRLDVHNGAFEVYDISSDIITAARPLGQVGLEWTINPPRRSLLTPRALALQFRPRATRRLPC